MNCPVCDVDLQMSERQGIEIDYCPKCRGVWLDRGELDKIIERAGNEYASPGGGRDEQRRPDEPRRQEHRDDRKRKKGGFLGDIFEGLGS